MGVRRWTGIGVLLSALSITPLLIWSVATPEPRRFVDLAVYQQAGRTVLSGGDLYAFETANGLPFTYPPFAALLAVPLGPLGAALAGLLWVALTIVALAFLALRCSRPLRTALIERWGLRAGALAGGSLLAAALWLQPVRDTIRFGQVGVLLAALVGLRPAGLRRARRGPGRGAARCCTRRFPRPAVRPRTGR